MMVLELPYCVNDITLCENLAVDNKMPNIIV